MQSAQTNREDRAGDKLQDAVVLEFASGHVTASVCAKILADLGATVLKVEDIAGDTLRHEPPDALSLFTLLNGNKYSVGLDGRQAAAREAVEALCTRATAIILDQEGGQRLAALLGRDPAAAFPHLTLCHCTPFGLTGRWAGWVGGEEIVQALSGVMSTTGDPESGPMRISGAMLTHAAAMFAATATIADLIAKGDGRGRHIDAAMIDAAIAFLTAALPYYALHHTPPLGIGNRHTMAAPWNSFRCSDGWLILCAGNDPTWQRLCHAIARPDLLTDSDYATQEGRVRHIEALEAEITAWTQQHSVEQAERLLDTAGVPSGSIASPEHVLTHAQFKARALLRGQSGETILGGLFFRNGAPLPIARGQSALGAGNEAAFALCGVAPTTVQRWHATGVLHGAQQE